MASIGIIGAGQIGTAIAHQFARKRIEATISNSRGRESLVDIVASIGPTIKAGSREDAAAKDIVFIAVPWLDLREALAGWDAQESKLLIQRCEDGLHGRCQSG